jgi:SAM-dependent methyltransferase
VLGVDISEPMLERAGQRVAQQPAIEILVGDAQTHPFAPADFDAVFSRFGVMFFEDERRAFANLRRALRPEGRLAFVCWQDLALNPWAALPLSAVMRLLPPGALPVLLRPGCPGPFNFSDPDRVQPILLDAGFADVRFDRLERPLHMGGAMTLDDALAYCRQIGPAARAMADADPTLRPALENEIAAALAPFVSERGVWLDAAAFVVTARAR